MHALDSTPIVYTHYLTQKYLHVGITKRLRTNNNQKAAISKTVMLGLVSLVSQRSITSDVSRVVAQAFLDLESTRKPFKLNLAHSLVHRRYKVSDRRVLDVMMLLTQLTLYNYTQNYTILCEKLLATSCDGVLDTWIRSCSNSFFSNVFYLDLVSLALLRQSLYY